MWWRDQTLLGYDRMGLQTYIRTKDDDTDVTWVGHMPSDVSTCYFTYWHRPGWW